MKKLLVIVLLLLMQTSAFSEPRYRESSDSLWPPGVPFRTLFSNVSTVGVGDMINTNFFPRAGAYEVVPFGNNTSFTFTIDVSLRCIEDDEDNFHAISTVDQDTAVLYRGFATEGYRCFRPNLRALGGPGGISVYFMERGE